jgi:tetratricopeptide (TPR) repeat protein
VLAELTRAHLLEEHAPGRYAFHDLLRAYAAELAGALDADAEPRDALHRLLDHYLHSAHAADRLLFPYREPIPLGAPVATVVPERFADRAAAGAWFAAEHAALLAAVELAADSGFDEQAWQLTWALQTFLERNGRFTEAVTTWHAALAAARRLGDRRVQARAHRNLASAEITLGRLDEADGHGGEALAIYRDLGDRTGMAHTHRSMVAVCDRRGRHADGLGHSEQALALYQATGDRHGQAYALSNAGWCHAQLGDQPAAQAACWQALTLLREIGDRWGEAATWDTLGYSQHLLHDYAQATTSYQRALALLRELGDRHREAVTLGHLGDTRDADGDTVGARLFWQDAVRILEALDHPDAAEARAKLYPPPRPVANSS